MIVLRLPNDMNGRVRRALRSLRFDTVKGAIATVLLLGVPVVVQAQIPVIDSIQPHKQAISVSPSGNITAWFSIAMDPTSFTTNSVRVFGSLTGKRTGVITYQALSKSVVFNPDSNFIAGEQVTCILTTGIRSSGGIPLSVGLAWTFTAATSLGEGALAFDSTYPLSTGVAAAPTSGCRRLRSERPPRRGCCQQRHQ